MAKSGLSRGNIADQRFIEDVANKYIVDAFIDVSAVAPGSGLPAATNEQQYVVDAGSGSILGGWGTITGVTDKCIIKYNTTIAKWQLVFSPILAEEGATLYDKESDKILAFDGAEWIIASGAGGGGDTTLLFEDFENTSPTDFFTSVSGTLTLSDDILNPLVQETTAKITQTSALIDDYIEKIIELPIAKTDWSLAPIKIETLNEITGGIGEWALEISESVDDVTYTQVAYAEINNGTQTLKNITKLNEATLYLKLKYKVVVADDTTTLRIGRIKIASDAFEVGQITKINSVSLSGNDGRVITFATEDIYFIGSGTGWESSGDSHKYRVQYDNAKALISCGVDALAANYDLAIYINGTLYKTFAESNAATSIKTGTIVIPEGVLNRGDLISVRSPTDSLALENVATNHYLNIVETAYADNVIVDAATFSTTQTKILSSNVTTIGDIASLTFSNLTIGKEYVVEGQIYTGPSGGRAYLKFISNSIEQSRILNNTGVELPQQISFKFTALSTTLIVNKVESGGIIYGDNTRGLSYLQLSEAPPAFISLDVSSVRENFFRARVAAYSGTPVISKQTPTWLSSTVIDLGGGQYQFTYTTPKTSLPVLFTTLNQTPQTAGEVTIFDETLTGFKVSIFTSTGASYQDRDFNILMALMDTDYRPQQSFIAGQVALTEARTDGVEYRTNEKVDGQWVYARSFNLTSYTSGTMITNIPTSYEIVSTNGMLRNTAGNWYPINASTGSSSVGSVEILSSGNLSVQFTGVGTLNKLRLTIKYLK